MAAVCSSLTVFLSGWEGEEDEDYGGAYEGDRTVAAQRQTAPQRESGSAQRPGQSETLKTFKWFSVLS